MTVKELKDYLTNYGDDEEIGILAGDVSKRIAYELKEYLLIRKDNDFPSPVIFLNVCNPMSFDEISKEVEDAEAD